MSRAKYESGPRQTDRQTDRKRKALGGRDGVLRLSDRVGRDPGGLICRLVLSKKLENVIIHLEPPPSRTHASTRTHGVIWNNLPQNAYEIALKSLGGSSNIAPLVLCPLLGYVCIHIYIYIHIYACVHCVCVCARARARAILRAQILICLYVHCTLHIVCGVGWWQ